MSKQPGQIQTVLEKNMSEILDIPLNRALAKEDSKNVVVHEPVKEEVPSKVDTDFDIARESLQSLLNTGQEALLYALGVAKQSDDPKAYEAVSNLIANLGTINEQMMRLHLQHQKHKLQSVPDNNKNNQSQGQSGTTNNAIFIGTGADLSKLVAGMNLGALPMNNNVNTIKDIENDDITG